jgi:hypothetical protein
MQTTQVQINTQEKIVCVNGKIAEFFATFHIGSLLNRSGIRKIRGARPLVILTSLFSLPFQGLNLYWGIVQNRELGFLKDSVYDILKRPNFNWRIFLLSLSVKVIRFITSLSDASRETVFILDDSTFNRSRSKVVELLAKVYDHSTKKYLKGFRFLSLVWSDGSSTVPVDFALLSSKNKKNRYQDITKDLDKRCCGYRRRNEAMKASTELLEPMVKRAIRAGIIARYILIDSWFAFPSIITSLSVYLPVICMLKRMPKVYYTFCEQKLNLKALYKTVKKRPGKARIVASVLVSLASKQIVKIVFVRDRRKNDWLAILSTNVELADTEIVRIYGKRWDIEVFFKMSKQYLQLEKGVQMRDFDGLIAHTTIALVRYIFLSYLQRLDSDPRTIGTLFRAGCDEIRDVSLIEALQRIITLVIKALRKTEMISEQFIQQLIDDIMGTVLEKMNLKSLYPAISLPYN